MSLKMLGNKVMIIRTMKGKEQHELYEGILPKDKYNDFENGLFTRNELGAFQFEAIIERLGMCPEKQYYLLLDYTHEQDN